MIMGDSRLQKQQIRYIEGVSKLRSILSTSLFSFLITLGTSAFAADELNSIRWNEADQHVGETVSVCGPVAFAGPIGLTPTAAGIILGGDPVDRANAFKDDWRFKIVLLDYHEGFPQNISEHFMGKEICVAGSIIWALAGGTEILPVTPSQLAIQGEGTARMPRGDVESLPEGAISFRDAKNHVGETGTVCGVAVAVRPEVPRNDTLNMEYKVPEKAQSQFGDDTVLFSDERTKHRIILGDFSKFEIYIPVEKADWLANTDIKQHFMNKEMCATGLIAHTAAAGASITVEDPDSLWFLE